MIAFAHLWTMLHARMARRAHERLVARSVRLQKILRDEGLSRVAARRATAEFFHGIGS